MSFLGVVKKSVIHNSGFPVYDHRVDEQIFKSAGIPADGNEAQRDLLFEGIRRDMEQARRAESVLLLDRLTKVGRAPLPPSEVSDIQIPRALDSLIIDLARLGVLLSYTDHLSDRKLYEQLYHIVCHDPILLMPGGNQMAVIECLGHDTYEDLEIWLRYYADRVERKWWTENYPEMRMPRHREPKYDRDRYLPGR